MSDNLLILGASTRAAAFSALAAGLAPVCGDRFADADLAAVARVTAAVGYPAGLETIARASPPGAWMYTGALENYPALVTRIASQRTLYGNPACVLARVRDPFLVAHVLARAGLLAPELRRTPDRLPTDGAWLSKPYRSCGGQGIFSWRGNAGAIVPGRGRHYFQRRAEGVPCAAIYLAAAGTARLLGATEQLLLARLPGELACRYAGSLGPLPLDEARTVVLARIGQVLCAEFGLVGLFGVDYIDDGRDIWAIEVNPRYTASVEILERATGFSAVGWHVAVCRDRRLPEAAPAVSSSWHAKRILYVPCGATITDAFSRAALACADRACTELADIPASGTRIQPGGPVMTVFAQADSRPEALARLQEGLARWEGRLLDQCPAGNAQ